MTQSSRPRSRGLRFLAVGAAALLASTWAGVVPAGAENVVVDGDDTAPFVQVAYQFAGFEGDPCDGEVAGADPNQTFVSGPETPPAGTGSLRFNEDAGAGHADAIITEVLDDVALNDVDAIEYSTYVEAEGQEPPALQLFVDRDLDGDVDDTLTYIPSENAAVVADQWQTWVITHDQGNFFVNDEDVAVTIDTYLGRAEVDDEAAIVNREAADGPRESGGVQFVESCETADAANSHIDRVVFDLRLAEADVYDFEPAAQPGPGDDPEYTQGYRLVAADGGIFTFGDRRFHGSTGDIELNAPILGGATDIGDYDGYWIVAADGGVFAFNAPFYGSLGDEDIDAPAVEIEPTPSGQGYWIVLADGSVYEFGDAEHFGDMAGEDMNQPIIGMSVTSTGLGYWLVGEDGGIFSFGDADFHGSTGDMKLTAPIIDLAPAVDNNGYYLVGLDGGVFAFGSAEFKGSTGNITLNDPVVAMLVAPNGAGYWLAATDGGVFTFGAVDFLGSMGCCPLNAPVLDMIH